MENNAYALVEQIRGLRRKYRFSKLEVQACEQYLRELENCRCSYSVVHRGELQLENAKIVMGEYVERIIALQTLAAEYISKMENDTERAILMSVIVNGRSVKETAKAIHYSLRTVYRMKDEAMIDLDYIIERCHQRNIL